MAINLSGVQRVVEGTLLDRVQLRRDVLGHGDDVLDEETGELVTVPPACVIVWEGAGAVMPHGVPRASALLDNVLTAPAPSLDYRGFLPLSAPPARPGDALWVIGSSRSDSLRDPYLVGRAFRVGESDTGSFAVVRTVLLQAID
ncbi:DUF6093 family protein [Streptomyces polyrhachis]|uniref:DUF6093 family protein n=1 Tax=Streptomyces polyrhachis TaxID=1282885 RepID=A0ABW2GLI4_9ACTN